MAMAGLRPVVAVYSTFFSRAFDQANLDVGLHKLPVVLVLDRAGITGDDGPSHHGVLDMALCLSIPGMTVFAPSSAPEVEAMLATALTLDGPVGHPLPEDTGPAVAPGVRGSGLEARLVRQGDGSVCILAVGKMLGCRRGGGRRLSEPRVSTSRCGTCGWSPPRPGHAGRRRQPRPGGHRRGRRAPRRGGDVPGRRAPASACRSGTCPPVVHQGVPRSLPGPGAPRPDPGPTRARRGRHRPHASGRAWPSSSTRPSCAPSTGPTAGRCPAARDLRLRAPQGRPAATLGLTAEPLAGTCAGRPVRRASNRNLFYYLRR